jgi:(Z)-2-((N-methylformamido)methylene)-5-hydroxybutyrolactone dehydrogenase
VLGCLRGAARLCAGTVWINDYRVVGPGMPFGDALNEYTETTSVFVELTGEVRDPFRMG